MWVLEGTEYVAEGTIRKREGRAETQFPTRAPSDLISFHQKPHFCFHHVVWLRTRPPACDHDCGGVGSRIRTFELIFKIQKKDMKPTEEEGMRTVTGNRDTGS